ncbi:winged helix domain-containing protein [Rhizobium leguminosarum]|uniref:winged helix domain-containing protein n=1 Tax=Rhizobium leguminosarum TaxID=384 RepID=UPI0013BCC6CD|nr:hypothetical protein [Rhizobium leguminosarum]NEI65590.1 hypothetical protein [Rhizobium leguminosarum]
MRSPQEQINIQALLDLREHDVEGLHAVHGTVHHESHGGPLAGNHGRYLLRSVVTSIKGHE